MPTCAPQRTIDHAQIAALRAIVRQRQLVDPDDFLLIDQLLGVASDLTIALAHKPTQFDQCEHVANCLLPIFLELEQLAALAGTFVLDDTTVRILDLSRENKTLPEGERRGMGTTGIIARGPTQVPGARAPGVRRSGNGVPG